MSFIKQLFWIFLLALITACGDTPRQEVKKEAIALCALFEEKHLEEVYKEPDTNPYYKLAIDTKNIIKSKEYMGVFEQIANNPVKTDYYEDLQPRVSQLIGEEWHCENMQKFYDITYLHDEDIEPSKQNKLMLRISNNGKIEIGNKKYNFIDTKSWREKLKQYINKFKITHVAVALPTDRYMMTDLKVLVNLFHELEMPKKRIQYQEYIANTEKNSIELHISADGYRIHFNAQTFKFSKLELWKESLAQYIKQNKPHSVKIYAPMNKNYKNKLGSLAIVLREFGMDENKITYLNSIK
jgi:hypothetical protein